MKRSCLVQLALLAAGCPVLLHQALGLHALVLGVVAGVALDDAFAQLEDAGGHAVEELGVVGDDQQRAVVLEQVSRPSQSWAAVSRWFVGSSSSMWSGRRTSTLARAMRICQPPLNSPQSLLAVVGLEAEAVEHAADARLDAVAVLALELLEQRGLLIDQGVEVAFAAPRCGEAISSRRSSASRASGKAVQSSSTSDAARVEPGLLAEVAELVAAAAESALAPATPASTPSSPAMHAEQRGLAGAVGADEPDALALADDERDALQHVQWPERFLGRFRKQHVESVSKMGLSDLFHDQFAGFACGKSGSPV